MQRDNIALLRNARIDATSRREVGRRYLYGAGGFPKNENEGLGYLLHVDLRGCPETALIVTEAFELSQIVSRGLVPLLRTAAEGGRPSAQFKLGVWYGLTGCWSDSTRLFRQAAAAGYPGASSMAAHHEGSRPGAWSDAAAILLANHPALNLAKIAELVGRKALQGDDLERAVTAARLALVAQGTRMTDDCAEFVVAAVHAADGRDDLGRHLPIDKVQRCLALRADAGDSRTAYRLGRWLCGMEGIAGRSPEAQDKNVRRGVAYLYRSADVGLSEAWMSLYAIHANHRSSISNPELARNFLEKAAREGHVAAKRHLGLLKLRTARRLEDSENAIEWLFQAASDGDARAGDLLKTLVLPVAGADADAAEVIRTVQQDDPWLAMRLRVSRAFGLTRLEALCMDPSLCLRPWGLSIQKNPFISQARLAAPRAVPALGRTELDCAHRAALFFVDGARNGGLREGDWTSRSSRQRRLFAKLGIDAEMFFATVDSQTLDTLRRGRKWALRVKREFDDALAV